MVTEIQDILVKYWGHRSFRPLQEDIIMSVLQGRDTLALLPTGGGKSVCFQIPAMAKPGLCLVISPLIALMKDQVENLKKRGIKAIAIHSGMHYNEIDLALDNCAHGDVKFLYLSPERLASELFIHRLKKMKLNLIAVDEAHCVSQWGYDFRPPYLQIADIRKYVPDIPLLALTATATPDVVSDIQQKLLFREENVFRKSFERKNLTYAVIKEEDKLNRLIRFISKVSGIGIVYVRNRRKTREIAEFLTRNGIKADSYHAGLDHKTRDQRQNSWIKEEIRVIVATNAFGMGIDKPNVRFVMHFDLPDSIEAYFQEAGRAGRDEKKAYAMLMFNESDIIDARHNLNDSFPEPAVIREIYNALGNYYNLAVGSGKDKAFDFDISAFCNTYNLKPLNVYNALKFIEREGYLLTTESLYSPSKLHFCVDRETLYRFQVTSKNYDQFIKTILRSYGGIFDDYISVSETDLAFRTKLSKEEVIKNIKYLESISLVKYFPQKQLPQMVYTTERMDKKNLLISNEHYYERKAIAEKKLEAVIHYATSNLKCRSSILLEYFGDKDAKRCGQCDICLERNKLVLNELEFDGVVEQIKPMLRKQPLTLENLVDQSKFANEDKIIKVVQWLMDNQRICMNDEGLLVWCK
jgi:ATP-dependent DNA helicase RecQ